MTSAATSSGASTRRIDPWIGIFVGFIAAPVVLGLGYAALYSFGAVGLLSRGWTLAIWEAALTDRETWVSLGFSLYVAGAGLLASTGLALGLVLALGAEVRRGVLGHLLYLPLAMPPVAAGLLGVQIFGDAGLVSRIAYAAGLTHSPMEFPALVFDRRGLGIILTHIALLTPFLVLLFDRLERNERIGELVRLAQTLGASRAHAALQVTIPVLLRRAAPTLSAYFIFFAGAFDVPLLVGAQYPAMISVLVRRRFTLFDLRSKPEAYALASLYAVLMLVGLVILFRARRDESASAELMP